MTGGLLVVGAHPDDEALIAGGVLAACAAAGEPTAVVCLTRGEHGPIADPAMATREQLPAVRQRELAAACAVLGVETVRCWRRADGELPGADGSAIARQIAGVVESLRPDAVLTFWHDGLYWHPDHIATLEFTRRALARVADPPGLLCSTWPDTLAATIVGTLAARGLPHSLWEIDPSAFGEDEMETWAALELGPFATRKLAALRAHQTQIDAGHAFAAMPAELAGGLLGTEWVRPDDGSGAAGERALAWLSAAVARGRVQDVAPHRG